MPRFAIGDRVITPKGEAGEIVTVWPKGPQGSPSYNVSLPGKRIATVFLERELAAAPHLPDGRLVSCADCRKGKPTHYSRNVVHCAEFCRVKSKRSQRICAYFAPHKPTTGEAQQ